MSPHLSEPVSPLHVERGRTRPAPGHPSELVVRVTGVGPARLTHDGSELVLDGSLLRVTGPERDVFAVADGIAHQRARGDDVVIDLQAAWDRRALGGAKPDSSWPTPSLRHEHALDPVPPRPDQPVTITVYADHGADEVRVSMTTDGTHPPDPRADPHSVGLASEDGCRWHGALPAQPDGTLVRYRLAARTGEEWEPVADAAPLYWSPRPSLGVVQPPAEVFAYRSGGLPVPDWAADAVIYHLLVDRFAAEAAGSMRTVDELGHLAFAGGTLAGIAERLDHVVGLGCNTVLLSPITHGESGNSYDARDLRSVDPRFGTVDDARRLVEEAHRRGLRVLLDLELSYLGASHPRARQALLQPDDAEARRWFRHDPDDGVLWGWLGGNPMYRPLDHEQVDLRAELIDSARWFLDLGFDGFRLDSAQTATLDFWAEVGHRLHSSHPEALLVGEVTRPVHEQARFAGRLHGTLDFALEEAVRAFAAGDGDAGPRLLATAERSATSPMLHPAFVECHDDTRFTELVDDPKRLAAALLLLVALPGPPILLYGTEWGLVDDHCGDWGLRVRQPVPWDEPPADRRRLVGAVTDLRRHHPPLRRGAFEPQGASDGFLRFRRSAAGSSLVVEADARDGWTRMLHDRGEAIVHSDDLV